MLHERFGKGKGFRTNCKANDKIFTPKPIAAKIISLCPFEGGQTVLDGFKGGGAFYNQYPENIEKDWCEIDEGRDFFDYRSPINWIVSNPPYSIFDEVLIHSFEIAENVMYLVPMSKLCSSMKRVRMIISYGGIKEIHIISASKCGFPFGFPCCAVWIQQEYKGQTAIKELII